jgi:hypothetical protein
MRARLSSAGDWGAVVIDWGACFTVIPDYALVGQIGDERATNSYLVLVLPEQCSESKDRAKVDDS